MEEVDRGYYTAKVRGVTESFLERCGKGVDANGVLDEQNLECMNDFNTMIEVGFQKYRELFDDQNHMRHYGLASGMLNQALPQFSKLEKTVVYDKI
jgi:hypothetical protein